MWIYQVKRHGQLPSWSSRVGDGQRQKISHNTNTITLWQNAVSTWQNYTPNLYDKAHGTHVTKCTKFYYIQLPWYVTWHTASAYYGILLHYNSRLSIQIKYWLCLSFSRKWTRHRQKHVGALMFLTCKMYVIIVSIPFDATVHIAIL